MKKHFRERLLMLAYYLGRIKSTGREFDLDIKEFDLSTWRSPRTCGTAACAIGLAMDIPWFISRGFKRAHESDRFPTYTGKKGSRENWLDCWDAVEKFFGINFDEAFHLFSSATYASNYDPKAVATRIRKFVRTKDREAKLAAC